MDVEPDHLSPATMRLFSEEQAQNILTAPDSESAGAACFQESITGLVLAAFRAEHP